MSEPSDNGQNITGFDSGDLAAPKGRRELAAEDKMAIALNTWRRTGSIAKVRNALGLKGERPAIVWLNRAIKAYEWEVAEERDAVFRLMADRYLGVLSTLFDEFEAGDRSKINELKAIGDRVAKLYGVDAVREVEAGGTQITVVTGLPGVLLNGQVIEGQEVTPVKEIEPGNDEGPPQEP